MSDLERTVLEAIKNMEQRGLVGMYGFPEAVKALLAEKDAALESLTKQIADIRRAHLEEIRDLNRDARDAVAEARWEERQGEDYGSY